jgi:cytochrome b561
MVKVSRYHPLLVALHWIIAVLALGALVMARIPNTDPMKLEALRSHMTGGALILVLMAGRLFVRMRTAHPTTATTGSPALDRVAWLSHRLLYALMLGQAVSGLFMALQAGLLDIVFLHRGELPADFWDLPVRSVHYAISRLLMVLIALHVTGALYHTLIRRDGLIRRMWFGRRVISASDTTAAPNPSSAMVRS